MKIGLTGATGQFGQALQELASSRVEIVPLSRPDFDLTSHTSIRENILAAGADWIVHAAAMTDVDRCEREPQSAHRVNAEATATVAETAREVGSRLVYISTDYVFNGARGPYSETAGPSPVNQYGASKLAGETAARHADPRSIVARTSVVFGPHKRNFVTWVRDELRASRPVRIVEDQIVSPTYTFDLARQVMTLIEEGRSGIYNTAGRSILSRLEMARQIARSYDLPGELVQPIKSSDLQWLATRPMNSSLSVSKIESLVAPMTFAEALLDLKART